MNNISNFPIHKFLSQGIRLGLIALLLNACSLFDLKGQDAQALGILNKSKAEMNTLTSETYTLKNHTKKGTLILDSVQKIFFKHNPDGTVWQRIESSASSDKGAGRNLPSDKAVQVQNAEGLWQLQDNKRLAIRMSFMEGEQQKMQEEAASSGTSANFSNDDATYTVSEKTENGDSFYVISKQLSDKTYQKIRDTANQLVASILPNKKLDVSDKLPFLTETLIRKSDYIIMGQTTYTKDGDLIDSAIYTDMRINVPLSDDLFAIPIHYQRVIAKNPQDFIKEIYNQ